VDGALQEIGRWHEVRVEDGNEFSFSAVQALCQGTGFEPMAIGAMVIGDGVSLRGIMLDQAARHRYGFVSGIVQNLNIEFVQRVIELADGIQQTLDDKLLIEDRKLNRDMR
jgi:hypothetical protein